MEVARVRADELAEPPLHVRVDVLERRVEADLARRELRADLLERADDPARRRLRHDALLGEHGDVGLAAADVLRVEGAVVPDRDGERDEPGVGLPASAARETGFAFVFGLMGPGTLAHPSLPRNPCDSPWLSPASGAS